MRSIAASEVEGLVLGQVRRLLASPELVARTITEVRRESCAVEHPILEEHDVIVGSVGNLRMVRVATGCNTPAEHDGVP